MPSGLVRAASASHLPQKPPARRSSWPDHPRRSLRRGRFRSRAACTGLRSSHRVRPTVADASGGAERRPPIWKADSRRRRRGAARGGSHCTPMIDVCRGFSTSRDEISERLVACVAVVGLPRRRRLHRRSRRRRRKGRAETRSRSPLRHGHRAADSGTSGGRGARRRSAAAPGPPVDRVGEAVLVPPLPGSAGGGTDGSVHA